MRRARSPDKTRELLDGTPPLLRDGKVERRRQGNAEIVLSPRRGATGGPAERFGHPGGPSRRRGWTEEERIYRCATTKGRAPQRTDRAAWGPKIRPASPVAALSAMSTPAQRMVAAQLLPNGVIDPRVIAAMSEIPREEFLSGRLRRHAYENRALAIQCGQTISQPLVVALMTQAAAARPEGNPLHAPPGSGHPQT